MGGTVEEVLRRTARTLAGLGSGNAAVEAAWLVGAVTGLDRAALVAAPDRALGPGELAALEGLLTRRAGGEPLQYVLGEWGFRRLTLTVDRRALIPRPETEVVVERCLARLSPFAAPRVLDVGTGSGAIALALADEHPSARVTAIDASAAALALARENAARTGLEVTLLRHDLFEGLPAGPWELVVSNPPYVEPGELTALAAEVRDWEPHEALVGGGHTFAVAEGAFRVLAPGGSLVLETHGLHAARVAASLRELGYDRSLSDISSEVTDAASRLEYIATLTEQAANKVLNSIDEAMPVQDEMMSRGADIEKRWTALFEGKLSVDEFKVLAQDSRSLASSVVETGEAEKARLMQIMMAQDFQDITGQIIEPF